ncbi:uncharacterized protein LOC107647162 [Arachis ipaensis]|uniref:uncharacterized protein LOC107647162 n=1 Tax=Arachis ipaensis TaxID=130454 RepID=UPI0007AF59C8|nr:uncharacterized protein LOC107647162 [Arachis ipaensis]XP_025661773.1 uncharacterized protein LOC112757398 [Arachis hypogaea]
MTYSLHFREERRFGELRLEVGMTFTTKMEFKEAVREYCIQEGRRILFKKNDNVRMRAVCKDESCGWLVYASNNTENNCWQIKTFMDDHTCARETKNRLANRKWLACKLVKKLRKYPNLRHSEAAQYLKTKCDLELNKSSLTRALGDARSVMYGDAAAQYGMVRDYGLTLLKSNPGSTVIVGVIPQPNPDDDPIFEKMYVCLEGYKKGFLAGCRPLIGLDGAFLKTRHGGQILSAIGQDANNHIYVIAYAIFPVENTKNWRWFLELLHQDLGDYKMNKLCFISDMQKGLINVVKEVFPYVYHRFCVWRLWKNFNKQWKDLQLRRLLWDCARCTSQDGILDIIKKIERVNKEAWEYLNKWPRDSWSRAFFSNAPKIDNICNNACEVFNSKIKDARAKPIITLLEEVRMYVMRSIARNKVKLNSNTGVLPPIRRSRLEKI